MSGFFHAHLTGVSPESRTVNLTSDCPVMSGFFHAPGHSAANFKYIVSDCPVMSGFFHARAHVVAMLRKVQKIDKLIEV